jgi:hypothetical protein
MTIVGQFRVVGDPGRFFWIRAFPDMEARAKALRNFYEGPVWRANRDAANKTMIDSDDVLLLHPAATHSGFELDGLTRPPEHAAEVDRSAFVSTIFNFDQPVENDFAVSFDAGFGASMRRLGMDPIARLVTDRSDNTYPKLPVREGVNAFVALATLSDETSFSVYSESLRRWEQSDDAFARKLHDRVSISRLIPTSRSLLR